jgi:hypothetical protein
MSVSTPVPALATQPQIASSSPAASTRRGLAIAIAIAATPVDSNRAAALPAGRSASPPPEAGFDPCQAESPSAANPPVSATTNARATPITRSSPNERTRGLGERAKTAKPAIVATHAAPITGPPPTAASATARPGAALSALASLKRAWNWIA